MAIGANMTARESGEALAHHDREAARCRAEIAQAAARIGEHSLALLGHRDWTQELALVERERELILKGMK